MCVRLLLFHFLSIVEHVHVDNETLPTTSSSYISDDCRVLYIETVIEVAKPMFYERTVNVDYRQSIPSTTSSQQRPLTAFTMTNADDDIVLHRRRLSSTDSSLKQYDDSGIEHEQTLTDDVQHRTSNIFESVVHDVRSTSNIVYRCLSSFVLACLIILALFSIYVCYLDRCSRSILITSIVRTIVRIERQGLPMI
jgi:hypothetical protein